MTAVSEEPRAATEPVDAGSCPRCGAEVDAAQEYCLECGLRLPRREGLAARLGDAWQRRLPWYPGDWVWPALGFLVIAAVGAAVAIVSTRDSSGAARTIVATSPVLSRAVRTTPVAPVPTVRQKAPPTATTKAPSAASHSRPQGLVQWPLSRSGYTLVLDSIPKANGVAGPTAEARRALAAGLPAVGVLDSDQFSSLHPGYFVVFSGSYGSFSDANAQAGRAHAAGWRLAYPRLITR